MVFYRPLHNKQRDKQYPPKCNPYTYTNAYIHTGSHTQYRFPKLICSAHDKEGTAPAKYTYEIYGLDKQKADIYTDCPKPFFIKTDNPDPELFFLDF